MTPCPFAPPGPFRPHEVRPWSSGGGFACRLCHQTWREEPAVVGRALIPTWPEGNA